MTSPQVAIQVADEAFVVAPARAVAARLSDPAALRRWFPDLVLTVREDRGEQGVRWSVGGAVTGTSEVWLEPMLDGVLVHYYLHVVSPEQAGDVAAQTRGRRLAGKAMVFELKRVLEAGRAAGEPPSLDVK